MFCMQRVAQICTSKTGALSVWRTKENVSPVYRALLPPQDETKNKRSHAFCWSSNDMVSPHLGPQTFVERTMTTVRLWIFSTITCKIPQYIFIKQRLNLADFQLIKHFCIFGTNLVSHLEIMASKTIKKLKL